MSTDERLLKAFEKIGDELNGIKALLAKQVEFQVSKITLDLNKNEEPLIKGGNIKSLEDEADQWQVKQMTTQTGHTLS